MRKALRGKLAMSDTDLLKILHAPQISIHTNSAQIERRDAQPPLLIFDGGLGIPELAVRASEQLNRAAHQFMAFFHRAISHGGPLLERMQTVREPGAFARTNGNCWLRENLPGSLSGFGGNLARQSASTLGLMTDLVYGLELG